MYHVGSNSANFILKVVHTTHK